jgi:hypothetical protein
MNLANVAPVPEVQPAVVYVASQPQAAPSPEQYTVANEPPATPAVVAPQTQAILDRQQWALDAQRAGR